MAVVKTDADWRREALQRIADRGGLPKPGDVQEIRRLMGELGNILDEYASDARTVAVAMQEEDEVPFEVEVQDIATLAIAAAEATAFIDELQDYVDKINCNLLDVNYAYRRQAGELTY